MSHEVETYQTVSTNGATDNIPIPLDKCFQLGLTVTAIRIESPTEIFLCVYNPTLSPTGIDPNSGAPILPLVPSLFVVGANTQVGNSDYLVCLSHTSESVTYTVTLTDDIHEDLV
jgi:hypothetical protein